MLDLVVIGHLLKEYIKFPDGKEIGPVLGSPAAYASVAAARLGLKTGLVTKMGKDMPEELLKVFKEAGVDIEGIQISDNTTTNLLIYEGSGKKKLRFLKKADNISFEDIPKEYLDAYFFLIAPIDYEVPESVVKFLYTKGRRLSMELSGFGGASSTEDGEIPREKRESFLQRITKYFEIVKGGKEDCQCLFGDLAEKEIAEKFIKWGSNVSIITLGGKGALVMGRENFFQIPSFPTDVVDCTGAGDVWHAGFLYAYIKVMQNLKLKTADAIKESAIFGSATASLVVEKTGGVTLSRMPTEEEVNQRTCQRSHLLRYSGIKFKDHTSGKAGQIPSGNNM